MHHAIALQHRLPSDQPNRPPCSSAASSPPPRRRARRCSHAPPHLASPAGRAPPHLASPAAARKDPPHPHLLPRRHRSCRSTAGQAPVAAATPLLAELYRISPPPCRRARVCIAAPSPPYLQLCPSSPRAGIQSRSCVRCCSWWAPPELPAGPHFRAHH